MNGAKHIVLLSRSGMSHPSAHKLLKEVAALGMEVSVEVVQCDIANAEQVRQLAQSLFKMSPVRGVIHGAMVLKVSRIQAQPDFGS